MSTSEKRGAETTVVGKVSTKATGSSAALAICGDKPINAKSGTVKNMLGVGFRSISFLKRV
jgi:hypothetical protein